MSSSTVASVRARSLVILLVAIFAAGALGTSTVAGAHTGQTAKKSKKCKRGYYRPSRGAKCKRKPMVIKPTKLVIVAAKLRDGMFNATAYAEFPALARIGKLCGRYELKGEGGIKRTRQLCWTYQQGSTTGGMAMYSIPLKYIGYAETATFVSGGARSNAQALIH